MIYSQQAQNNNLELDSYI